ncbi:MAG TPA: RNA methyltransferase [Pyrinomonadaceae bacterium]|nr:RNA methyltransferase [Pyrinomonadaceae bacterium]
MAEAPLLTRGLPPILFGKETYSDVSAEAITSRHNPLVKHVRAARDEKDSELIFVEGVRLCEEVARSIVIEDVLYTEELTRDARGAAILEELRVKARRVVPVTEEVLAAVSDTKTPQGIVALARRPRTDYDAFQRKLENEDAPPLVVVAHRVNNPSNAGAMLRVAEAAGATGFITSVGSTDVFSPKALRGAMGSSFRLPIWTGATFSEMILWCDQNGIRAVSTDVRATTLHTGLDWNVPRAIILGAEAGGLDEAESAAASERIKIPMRAPVESLNVATALAVILYEAARQRDEATRGKGTNGETGKG